jgi:restriction system protein
LQKPVKLRSAPARATAGGMEITLDDWLEALAAGISSPYFIDYHFLSGNQRDEFIARIDEFSEEEILLVLRRLLIRSGTLGQDKFSMASLEHCRENEPDRYAQMMRYSFNQRLIRFSGASSDEPPWEGITWVTDLLPDAPREALAALTAYSLAHCQMLPDGRVYGLADALAVIRARYIGVAKSQPERLQLLRDMEPRDFEHLVEELYNALGYETTLTPKAKDGGRDVVAKKREPSRRETILVECKRHSSPVGIGVVRALLGVVSDEKVNKGVVITPGRFTRHARELTGRNSRIELISGEDLIPLMNENLGADWVSRVDGLVLRSRTRNKCAT